MTLEEIIAKFSVRPNSSTKQGGEEFCSQNKMSLDAFYDALARSIAIDYAEERLSYRFCDAVINNLITFASFDVPEFCWSVFLAFDNGEFKRPGEAADVTPDTYTKPLIDAILANNKIA